MALLESSTIAAVPVTVGFITPLIMAITEGEIITARPSTKGRNNG
ncbi:MAG: hypothetical protein ABIN01_25180 [Ferruginibacter sp.]